MVGFSNIKMQRAQRAFDESANVPEVVGKGERAGIFARAETFSSPSRGLEMWREPRNRSLPSLKNELGPS